MSKWTTQKVARKVREYLEDCRPDGLMLEVMEDQILHGEGWWRVPVRPSAMPPKLYQYYEAMVEVEEELQEKEGLNILFMTSEPVEATLSS
jgi:hypothetical protein